MKYNTQLTVETNIEENKIIQEMSSQHFDARQRISRQIIDVSEHQIREALINMGWTPPKDK